MPELDDILGEGATQAFETAVKTSPDSQPTIFYSDWEYQEITQVKLVNLQVVSVTPTGTAWPGPGIWRKVTIFWPDAKQEVFFKDGIIHWGSGLCQTGGGDSGILKNLASPEMKAFLATYIDEMKIALPNLGAFYNRFLLGGFEIVDQNDNEVLVSATLKDPDSKMAQLFNWRINGTDPENEPTWRTQVRQDIGLETLFPE